MARVKKEAAPKKEAEVETEVVGEVRVSQALIDAAADVNDVFGLDPILDTTLPEVELLAALTTAAADTMAADEKDLQPETWVFLADNNMLGHLEKKKPAKKVAKKVAAKKVAAKKEPKLDDDGNPIAKKAGGFAKRADTDERNKMIKDLITEGKSTAPQIVAAIMEKYPEHKKSSVQTFVSDSKNAKYCKFDKPATMDPETKILSF